MCEAEFEEEDEILPAPNSSIRLNFLEATTKREIRLFNWFIVQLIEKRAKRLRNI